MVSPPRTSENQCASRYIRLNATVPTMAAQMARLNPRQPVRALEVPMAYAMYPESTTTVRTWALGKPQGSRFGRGRSTAHLAII